MRAAAQVVPAAGESDASVPCCCMNGWQSRWLWQRRRTTPHEDRSLPQSSGRRRSTRCTTAHGHRSDLLRGSGRASFRSPGRSAGDSYPTLGLPVLAEVSGDALDASTVRYLSAAARLAQSQQRQQQWREEDQEWERTGRRGGRGRRGGGRGCRKPPPHCCDLFLARFALGNLDIFPVVLPGVRCLGAACRVLGYWISVRWLLRCFRILRSAWSDGYTHMRQSTRHLDGFFFWCVFCGPLHLAVTCSALCSVLWTFPGDDFWKNSVFSCFWFVSGYMVSQSTEGWVFSTRRRASVVSSLSVAVLWVFAWLVSRRTVPVHRRCQGVFLLYFFGSDVVLEYKIRYFLVDSRIQRYLVRQWIHVCVSSRGLLDQGVDMPVVMLDSLVQTVQRPVTGPVLGQVVDVSVVVQRQVRGSMVRKTVVVPQLQFIDGRRHPCLYAEADSHGPACSENHGDSPLARRHGGRCPVVLVVQVLPGRLWLRQSSSHSTCSLRKSLCLSRSSTSLSWPSA